MDNFPADIWGQIMDRLDFDSIKALCCCSKYFHWGITNDVWTQQLNKLIGYNVTVANCKSIYFALSRKYRIRFTQKMRAEGYIQTVYAYYPLKKLFKNSNFLCIFTRTPTYPELYIRLIDGKYHYYRNIYAKVADDISANTVLFSHLGIYVHLDEISCILYN